MNIDVNSEQIALKDAVGDFLTGEGFDLQSATHGYREEQLNTLWQQCAEMGWFRSRLPEDQQGLALTMHDVAILHEEMGRHLLSIPVAQAVAIQTYLQPAHAHLNSWLTGRERLGFITDRSDHDHPPFLVEFASPSYKAIRLSWSQNQLSLSEFSYTEAGFGVDPLISTARTQHDTPPTLLMRASLSEQDWQSYQTLHDLLRMAELLGVGAKAMELSTAYAREREQFGKAIGAYQAIKHRLADDWMRLDQARLSLQEACRLMDIPNTDPEKSHLNFAVEATRLLVPEAAHQAALNAIQIHGAMGITWECPIHLLLKRVRHILASDSRFGNETQTLEALWEYSETNSDQ